MNSAGEFPSPSVDDALASGSFPFRSPHAWIARPYFREFAIPSSSRFSRQVLVSLTLTPLMCSRILKERGIDHRKTWTERFVARFFNPIRDAYGRNAALVSRSRWIAAPILIACGARRVVSLKQSRSVCCPPATAALFAAFSSFRKGARPISNVSFTTQLDPILQANPAVDKYFTVAAALGWVPRFTVLF